MVPGVQRPFGPSAGALGHHCEHAGVGANDRCAGLVWPLMMVLTVHVRERRGRRPLSSSQPTRRSTDRNSPLAGASRRDPARLGASSWSRREAGRAARDARLVSMAQSAVVVAGSPTAGALTSVTNRSSRATGLSGIDGPMVRLVSLGGRFDGTSR
jgi:hypothetical protein